MADLLTEFDEAGQTPLDPDEAEGLKLPVTTRAGLNAVEAENVAAAVAWLGGRRLREEDVIDEGFVRELHRRMFGQVWVWAGSYRRSDKNLGVPWFEIGVHVRRLLDDARVWLAAGTSPDESAVLFGHRIVSVHLFPNGNGRHSRLCSDCLARALNRPHFSWGARSFRTGLEARPHYLDALRAADGGDVAPLIRFARG